MPLRADAANLAYFITVGNSPGVESDIRQVSSQEYQISWAGVTLTRLLRLWVQPKARKMSVSCHPLNSSQNIHLGRIIRSNSLLISKFKPNAL